MVILITGHNGFIGSHLIPYLKSLGHQIVLFVGDVSDKKSIDNFQCKEKIDFIIHLAAVVNKKNKKVFEKVNVEGTRNIIEFCRQLNVKKFIFLSSIKVLSISKDPYTSSKRSAEKIVINSGLPYVIIRPSMIYGPRDNKNIGFLLKIAKFLPIMPLFDFKMQPVFIGDLIKIIYKCLEELDNKIFNIVGSETITFLDLLLGLKSSKKYKFFIIRMPRLFNFLIKIFSFLPFFPIPHWQVKGLLDNEVLNGCDWQKLFNIKATPFSFQVL